MTTTDMATATSCQTLSGKATTSETGCNSICSSYLSLSLSLSLRQSYSSLSLSLSLELLVGTVTVTWGAPPASDMDRLTAGRRRGRPDRRTNALRSARCWREGTRAKEKVPRRKELARSRHDARGGGAAETRKALLISRNALQRGVGVESISTETTAHGIW